jgi:hypothetical protein
MLVAIAMLAFGFYWVVRGIQKTGKYVKRDKSQNVQR